MKAATQEDSWNCRVKRNWERVELGAKWWELTEGGGGRLLRPSQDSAPRAIATPGGRDEACSPLSPNLKADDNHGENDGQLGGHPAPANVQNT